MPEHSYFHDRRNLHTNRGFTSLSPFVGCYFKKSFSTLLLMLVSVWVSQANAAVSVDTVSTEFDNNPSTFITSHTTSGTDRLMIVGVSILNEDQPDDVVISVTYDGDALAFIGAIEQENDSRVELWSYLNPPAITANVVVNFDEKIQSGAGVGVITFSGVDQSSPFGGFQSQSGESSTASIAVTSATGELVLGVMAAGRQDNSPVTTAGDQQWSYKVQNGNNKTVGAGATEAGAVSTTISWILNESDDWAVGAISIKPSSTSTGSCSAQTVADNFPAVSYSQNSGSQNWTGSWTELGESNGVSAGIARVRNDLCSSGNCLRLGVPTGSSTQTYSNRGIYREVDLSSASSATLSFVYRRGVKQGSQTVVLSISNNGGSSWTDLQGYFMNSSNTSPVSASFDITAYTNSNTQIRFLASGNNAVIGMYIDDINISYQPTCSATPVIDHHFDELNWNGTANEVEDSSGNNNHALANASSGLTTVNPGQVCRAGEFDGSNDHIESSSIFSTLRTTASLSFWIKTTQTGNDTGWTAPGIAGAEQSGGSDDIFWGWIDASGRIGISVANDYSSKSTVAINNGVYHHVVLTRDSPTGAYKIYIDGSLNNSGTIGIGDIGTNFSSIGRIEDTGGTPEYFQGDLDEVLVFSNVLSNAEVNSIYTEQLEGNNFDGSVRVCPAPALDFTISHDNTGIYCAVEPITVTAQNANNTTSTGYIGTITLDTQTGSGNWSLQTGSGSLIDVTADDGLATYTYNASDLGVAVFSLDYPDANATASINIRINDGAIIDDDTEGNLDFALVGFTVTRSALPNPPPDPIDLDLDTQIAGNQFEVHLAAYGTTPTDPMCGVVESYAGSKALTLTTSYKNPNSGTITASGSGAALFSNGQTLVNSKYKDVGEIILSFSDGTISGNSNNFVVKPASIVIAPAGSSIATPADHTGSIYTSAGTDFTVTVTAKDSEGATTPNYGNETLTPAETIALTHTLVLPNSASGGVNGILSGSLSKTGSGVFSGDFNWSEVGIIDLIAAVGDADYLDIGLSSTTSITTTLSNVGRFRPASFEVAITDVGEFENSCTLGATAFTYIGEDFKYESAPSFSVTAKNAAATPATTMNYQGDFVKLDGNSVTIDSITDDTSNLGADATTLLNIHFTSAATMTATPGTPGVVGYVFGDDTYQYGPDLAALDFSKESNSEVVPFNADIDPRITLVDDGETSSVVSYSIDIVGNDLRFGRVKMSNVHGSELTDLQMPMIVQYLNAGGFYVTNRDDYCTQLETDDLAVTPNLQAPGVSIVTVTSSTADAGNHGVILTAPGDGLDGDVLVSPNLNTSVDNWLKYNWDNGDEFDDDPGATATFGIFKGNPVHIYTQQIYQ